MHSMRSSCVRNLTTEAAQLAASWRRDPARFVREAFPWGEPGPLQAEPGPDNWQQDILTTIAEGLSPQRALADCRCVGTRTGQDGTRGLDHPVGDAHRGRHPRGGDGQY